MIYDKGVIKRHVYRDFGEFNLITREGESTIPRVPSREPLVAQAEHFLACVRHGVRAVSGALFALDVVRVLEACQQSIQRGGEPVALDGALD